jgi:hypothetical protein
MADWRVTFARAACQTGVPAVWLNRMKIIKKALPSESVSTTLARLDTLTV